MLKQDLNWSVRPVSATQPPSGGCVLKPLSEISANCALPPAAFGRLCVETLWKLKWRGSPVQPPSGGCVLKLSNCYPCRIWNFQPPSGGCVLKLHKKMLIYLLMKPAAFGRLCVETKASWNAPSSSVPAAFGRLCVETPYSLKVLSGVKPAAFGRLCVETSKIEIRRLQ